MKECGKSSGLGITITLLTQSITYVMHKWFLYRKKTSLYSTSSPPTNDHSHIQFHNLLSCENVSGLRKVVGCKKYKMSTTYSYTIQQVEKFCVCNALNALHFELSLIELFWLNQSSTINYTCELWHIKNFIVTISLSLSHTHTRACIY